MEKKDKIKKDKQEVHREIERRRAELSVKDDKFIHARDKFRTPSFLVKYIH